MKFSHIPRLPAWLFQLSPQVWILALGRFLCEFGTGFTLFYAPIFFVNQVGLSTTAVGFALGSASVSGIVGRILGGSFSDSPHIGRRNTLLLSLTIAAIGSFVLAGSNNFATLVVGNLITGLGTGLYWPATEAVVADQTKNENIREAFALTRLADNFGMGLGILLAGILVTTTGSYRTLFIIDGISFLVFFVVVYIGIRENYQSQKVSSAKKQQRSAWIEALRDQRLIVFVLVNIIFTTYNAQLHSTLPIYFKNFVVVETVQGFAASTISALFAWHLAIAIVTQLPVASLGRRLNHPQALSVSALLWAIGFSLIWLTGVTSIPLFWATTALGVFSIAVVSYAPSASALITEIAPQSQRGVYFSMNSLCWAVGYFIGPTLGGWALDQPTIVVDSFWLGLSLSVIVTIAILQYLNGMLSHRH
ncbi:MDR family MFS transporter [Iningainema tapete]|uniref:MFS transporter n=1 Tax=Iningainema tapete BLCC-T55 TaxID=2748662 RepID=A0A8J6XJM9_9CYAN|nr:MFS transporter [Iningainema tapete]MBD2774072.1 MFS transporter [Iningainema tapete BLCC-T55]